MTNLTIEMVNAMDRKELQAAAKSFGIKANLSNIALRDLITLAITPTTEEKESVDEMDEFEKFATGDVVLTEDALPEEMTTEEDKEMTTPVCRVCNGALPVSKKWTATVCPACVLDASETKEIPAAILADAKFYVNGASVASAKGEDKKPANTKVFEFIRSNHLGVVFNQKGVLVKIGWNPDDARCYIKVAGQPRKLMGIQTAIDKFKKFTNGKHGDVARIVKALVRIKKMPAVVVAKQQERKLASQAAKQNAPIVASEKPAARKAQKESSTVRYSGTIDASWLAEFRHEFEATNGRKPTGYEIKDAWMTRGA